MVNCIKSVASLALALSLFLTTSAPFAVAVPTDFDFSGAFENDNDILLLDFSLAQDSEVTIFSSSWVDFDTGLGFDPVLAIWDGSGELIAEQDDGRTAGSTDSNGVSYEHGVWDAYFTLSLGAGEYIASVTQYDNLALGSTLADGFFYDDNPNFTFDEGFGPAPLFNDIGGESRTGDWEVHILGVDSSSLNDPNQGGGMGGGGSDPTAPVPEPSTILLLCSGLLAGAWYRKR